MTKILVGVDGTARGDRAVEWAARRAHRTSSQLTLITAVGLDSAKAFGADTDAVRDTVEAALKGLAEKIVQECEGVQVDWLIHDEGILEALADASEGYDMVVLGSHHNAKIGEMLGGTKGLRLSITASVPTVVVPESWSFDDQGRGIVVGVGPDDFDEGAISFGVREAIATGETLELVSAWGLPAGLSRPAEAMGGGLGPVGDQFQAKIDAHIERIKAEHPELEVSGRTIEGSSPSKVLIAHGGKRRLLVMGTHARSAFGCAIFGSVTHDVLLSPNIPTVVVPKP